MGDAGSEGQDEAAQLRALAQGLALDRTVALVGLMGAGKTTVGRRLANALGLVFRDADAEIEHAAGLSVQEIFDRHGEADFRRGERGVIKRLLSDPPHVLATGGGAFIDAETRALMRESAISVWLRADLETLMRRVEKRDNRPLLKEPDPRAVMQRLMDARYPVYAEAELVIDSGAAPHANTVAAIIAALRARQAERARV